MPRYYFHVRDGIQLVRDEEGKEVAGLAEAISEAKKLAGDVRSEMAIIPRLADELRVEITDRSGKVLTSMPLDQAPRFH